MFTHMHCVRLILISEDAPEFTRPLPEGEWCSERDPNRITVMLNDSAKAVRAVVKNKIESRGAMRLHYDHPSSSSST